MKQFAFLIVSFFLLTACTDRDDKLVGVHIRIKNESDRTYDQVQVGDGDKLHKNISPGAFSDYMEYESAYSFAYINITIGEENYILQPHDFVGETPLEPGFYTYALNLSEEGIVQLEFIID